MYRQEQNINMKIVETIFYSENC